MTQLENTLFGVEHGAITTYQIGWHAATADRGEFINVEIGWAHRRRTSIVIVPRDEQALGHYLALWNDLTINGSWHSKAMAAVKVRRAIERCRESGALVTVLGGSLPKP